MLQNALPKAKLYRRFIFSVNPPVLIPVQRTSGLPFLTATSWNSVLPSLPHKSLQRCYLHSTARQTAVLGDDTIYALSTAPGRAGIAIVRISGPACVDVSSPSFESELSDRSRSTKAYVLQKRSLSLDLPLLERCTAQNRRPISSTPMPWFSTSLRPRPSRAKMSWNCIYMADLPR
jgi:hypothetical protein